MKKLFIYGLLLFISACSTKGIKTGDLVFFNLPCELCNSIENATPSYENMGISHVAAVVTVSDSGIFVIHASANGVVMQNLDTLIAEAEKKDGKPLVLLGRLKFPYNLHRKFFVKNLKKYLGKPYDSEFDISNDAYYCSELIYFAYVLPSGKHIFEVYPMNFKNLQTGKTDSVWQKYFSAKNMEIPQGKTGCNPGQMSLSRKIRIIKEF